MQINTFGDCKISKRIIKTNLAQNGQGRLKGNKTMWIHGFGNSTITKENYLNKSDTDVEWMRSSDRGVINSLCHELIQYVQWKSWQQYDTDGKVIGELSKISRI